MLLKKSYYNLIIDHLQNGDLLLFNTAACSFGILTNDMLSIYENIENIDIINLSDTEKDNVKIMYENGFLIDNEIIEDCSLIVNENLTKFSSNYMKTLTIAPTMNCNMECPYCFESKNNQIMSKDTQYALLNFIDTFVNDCSEFSVCWYGGEPLLCKDTIKYLSKEIQNICDKKNVKYTASIVTNGIFLDYDTALMLKNECKVDSAQVTIDGLEQTHNMRRKLKDKSLNSFKIITNNIDQIKNILEVNIRINIDKDNENEINNLIDYFMVEKQWCNNDLVKFYFAPIMKINDNCNIDGSSCLNIQNLMAFYLKANNIFKNNTGYNYLQMFYPTLRAVSCGGTTLNSFVVCPLGNLYNCWNDISKKEVNVGNVYEGIKYNKELTKWLTLPLPSECIQCKLRPICQGGCPYDRLIDNSPNCGKTKYMLKDVLKAIYNSFQEKQ